MFAIRQSIKPEFQEMYRGGNIKPTELLPFLHAQGQLPFNLAWFTKNYTLASYYGPVRNYVLTLYNVKEVTPEEWGAFDRVMLHFYPQPAIDLKAQGYDAVRCQFTSGMDAVLLLGANSDNCRDNGRKQIV